MSHNFGTCLCRHRAQEHVNNETKCDLCTCEVFSADDATLVRQREEAEQHERKSFAFAITSLANALDYFVEFEGKRALVHAPRGAVRTVSELFNRLCVLADDTRSLSDGAHESVSLHSKERGK